MLVVIISSNVLSQTYTSIFYPTTDTYVKFAVTTRKDAATTLMTLKQGGYLKGYALLKFNLSSMNQPWPDKKITSAILTLKRNSGTLATHLEKVCGSYAANWDGSIAWTGPVANPPAVNPTSAGIYYSYYWANGSTDAAFDVTNVINNSLLCNNELCWPDISNYSFLISPETDNIASNYYASESGYKPTLTIKWQYITGNVKSALAEEALQDTTSMLALNNNTDEPSLSVFPNPASEYISLSFSAEQAGTATAVITDLNGSTVASNTISLSSGLNIVDINTSSLASGSYFITVILENKIYRNKFVIIK